MLPVDLGLTPNKMREIISLFVITEVFKHVYDKNMQ